MAENRVEREDLNQQIYHGVLGMITNGIAIVDEKGIIVDHNQRLLEILDLKKKDLKNVPLNKIIPGLDLDSALTSDLYLHNQNLDIQVTVKKIFSHEKNGFLSIFSFSETYQAHKNNFEEVIDDHTVTKQSFENILNSIDEGVYVVDIKGNLCFYNPALERLEGYKSEDVLGKHVTELYQLDWESSVLLKTISTGKPVLDYYQEYYVNDRKVSVVCNAVPLFLDGMVSGAATIVRDFSRFKEMVEKNIDLQEKLISRTQNTNKPESNGLHFTFDQIMGLNKSIKDCVNWGKAAAKTNSSVFIYGETGTGKELFAQSIHAASSRSEGPFLAINCAAIPETLLEGILFGTSKGAFTGAINRVGMLEQANGGTFFLDEINSMNVTMQAKLLRALEERRIRRLGDDSSIPIDVRIVTSCNIEPNEAIDKGILRRDLFYRLAVVYLAIPPLRERMDDLELLSNFFIKQYNKHLGLNVQNLDLKVIGAFQKFHWPGNVRQLKHCIECAMNIVTPDADTIRLEHLPKYLFNQENHKPVRGNYLESGDTNKEDIFSQIENSEIDEIIFALKKNRGNVTRAAAELGISRQCLQYRIKKYNLNRSY
jgi:arginine utilization regulatory protein